MPEGPAHVALVDLLLHSVAGAVSGHEFVLFTDRAGERADCRCPNLGGYIPDLYGIGVRLSDARIVGEAKSAADFPAARTEPQLSAYLRHLATFRSSTLLLAVPFGTVPSATVLMRRLLEPRLNHVRLIVVASHVFRIINVGWAP